MRVGQLRAGLEGKSDDAEVLLVSDYGQLDEQLSVEVLDQEEIDARCIEATPDDFFLSIGL